MIDKKELCNTVKRELAKQWNCDIRAIDPEKNMYLEDGKQFFHMCTFGKNILIRGKKELCEWAEDQFADKPAKEIMDSENLYKIERELREYGKRLAGEHLRFLFLDSALPEKPRIELRFEVIGPEGMKQLHQWKGFNNALNYKSDVIAVGAFDGDVLAALAGADNNMEPLWQIGIDTLPEYRQKGIAVYIVNLLAREIAGRGKIPFYTTWSPNLASCRVALSSGFFPAWLEYFTEDVKE
jgi:GNAT superfamily N-acetyltransferase